MKKISWKWLIACVIMVQMAFGSVVGVFANDVNEPTIAGAPELSLVNGPVFDVEAGKSNEVNIVLKNVSSYAASSIVIKAVLNDLENNPIKVDFQGATNKVSNIAARAEKTTKLIVDVDRTAPTKTYSVTLKYTYFNANGVKYESSDTIYFKVQNIAAEPNFVIENYTVTPENIDAGQSGKVSATIRNMGPLDMFDTEISLDGLEAGGLSVNGMSTVTLKKIAAGTQTDFSFEIVTDSSMSIGNYPLSFALKYKDVNGKEYTNSQKFFVNVGGVSSGTKPALEIANMVEPSATFGVNENFEIKFQLKNTGDNTAKNVKITAAAASGENEVVPKSSSIETIKEMAAGETKEVSFLFAATSSAKSQNYPISFTVEYEDGTKKEGANNIVTFSQYAGVNINNPDGGEDGKTNKPKIIVSNYICDPIIVLAGQEFDLNLTFLNTHPSKSVKNVKMFLTLAEETSTDTAKTGNIFTPVNSSNTFYFDAIPSKGTVEKKLRLYCVPDAQPKTYTLTVNFEYEDQNGNEITGTELLGINVNQPTKLETGDIYVPEQVEMNMPVSLSFQLINTGKVTISNLMVKLEGDIDTQNKSTYLGNYDSGYSEYYEGEFYPNKEGESKVSVIISYDDPSGKHIEDVHEFTMNVMPPMPIEDMGDMGMDGMNGEGQTPGMSKNQLIGLGVGVVVVVIAIIAAGTIIKKRKAKAEEAFLLEEDKNDKVER